jgi:hypothetical protein
MAALRIAVLLQESVEICITGDQAFAAFLRLQLMLALLDPPAQPSSALVNGGLTFGLADLHASEACIVHGVRRNLDEGVRVLVGQGDLAIGPDRFEVVAPRFLQTFEEQIRAPEQKHFRRRRVALRQGGKVLLDHRLEQAGDDLLDWDAALDQCVGVGLCKDPAFRADLVKGPSAIGHLRQALRRDLQLSRGLLDEGAGPAAAGRLHVDLLALSRSAGRKENRLHILAPNLGHEADLGVKFLHRRRHGDHLLDELAAD